MTAEHAHGIDGGGEVEAGRRRTEAEARKCSQSGCPGDGRYQPPGRGHLLGCQHNAVVWVWETIADEPITRASAADAVLAEARRLCCGNNPSAHHAASAKHSERMAFAGDLARAVRGLSHG